MQEINVIIENNPIIFDVPDVAREQVFAEIVQAMAGKIAKRSQTRAQRQLRKALSLTEQTRRAAVEADYRGWIETINAPDMEAAQ